MKGLDRMTIARIIETDINTGVSCRSITAGGMRPFACVKQNRTDKTIPI